MFVSSSLSEMLNVGGSSEGPKPQDSHMDEDVLISSNPASPVSSIGEMVNNATPMPLLPHLLFSGATPTSISHMEPPKAVVPQQRLGLSSPPGFRTDPGAPPGCTENGLNILGGRYLLLDHLEGSHLQRCTDVQTKEEFVCKTVRNDPTGQAMLTAHSRVDGHPNVNPVQEVIVGDKFSYLLFPPCSTDLHSYVRTRRRLREPHARILFRQIVSAVHEAHSKGLVLRDLKLRKFVFTDESRTTLRLESLEDAVVLESEDDLLSDKHGCPAYVSPEILRTNSQYSGRAADMWGLGVMLYTMLVGRYPFHGQEHTGLFAKIRRGQFTLPDSISSRAKCLIRCLLRKDPTQRLTTEDVLIHPWVTLATPPSACHTSSSRESRRVSTATSGSGSSSATSMTSSNGGGNQLTPQMLTTPLGATLSLSGSSNLNSSSTSSSHHHSGLDSMDQLVPEFFPPQDEMDYSPFKY